MSGFLRRILNSFSAKARSKQSARNRTRRMLRVEALEGRSLMAMDLAVISGTAFVDVNSNSTFDSGTDTVVGGATVELFRDVNSNGTFETGTDTLVGTATTNATTGVYSFASTNAGGTLAANTLTAGGYFIRQLATASFVPPSAPALVTITSNDRLGTTIRSIDPFNVTAQTVQANAGTPTATSSVAASEVVGGERDIRATFTSGLANLDVAVVPGSSLFTFSSGANVIGTALVQYDGADGDATALNASGLAGISLNSNNALAGFQISTRGDSAGQSVVVRVYTDSTNFSTTTVTPPNQVTPEPIFIPFSSFTVGGGTGANFNSVGAIELAINGIIDQNTTVSVVRSAGPTTVSRNIINTPSLSIGNLVFLDRNSDGTFNGSDTGIQNVQVDLYNDVNGNGTFQSGTDTLVTSVNTNTTGNYLFEGLSAGNYLVVIPAAEFGTGEPLAGHRVAIQTGPVDTNNNNQGVAATGGIVVAAAVLAVGTEPVNDGDTNANTNLAVDLGFTNTTLSLTKTDSPDPVITGQNITYTLTATNNGPSTTTNTVFTDVLPTGLTFVSANFTVNGGAPQTATNTAGTVSTAGFSLNQGQAAVLTIIATVGATFSSGTTNTGSVDSDQTDAVTSQASTTVTPNVDLELLKTIVGGATVIGVGETLTYRLSLTNDSTVAVTNVQVFDDLPTGFNPGTLPTGVATGTAPNDLVWTITSIAAGATLTVDIPVTVTTTATVAAGQRNTATINIAGLTGFNDTDTTNNSSFVDVTVQPRYNLLVTKDNSATSVTTGQNVTYTITVNNSGPSDATNVQITDTLPTQLQFVSATSGGTPIGSATGQNYAATIPTLASGATTTILLVASVRANATGSVANTVNVAADNPTFETPGRANSATDTDTLNRVVTLNINKTDSTDTVTSGGSNFQYIVTAFNSGSADAPNVLFSDPLPTGVIFVSGTFEINESTPRTGTVTFNSTTNRLEANLGTLLANGSSTTNRALITLVVRADAGAVAGIVTNTATLTSPDNTVGVSDSETTQVTRSFDLTVSKTDNVDNVNRGQSVVYTIVVTNSGPSTATNVTVTDILPTGMTFQSASTGFTNNAGTITGNIASIASGQSATVTITATVNNDAPNGANLTNTATVTAAGETTTNNNTATAITTVLSTADISGTVFNDINGNGVQDTGESGIPNIPMVVLNTSNAVVQRAATNAQGLFTFTSLQLGTYTVAPSTGITSLENGSYLFLYTTNSTQAGTINGVTTGTGGSSQVSGINLTGNSISNLFSFSSIITNRWSVNDSPIV
jgi:uncharacterized repeat protein (TIGR01451 family)